MTDDTALFTTWTPQRSFPAVIGQMLLILAAVVIALDALDLMGAEVAPISGGWGMALGLELAVLGANCLNLTYWYPAAWEKSQAYPPTEAPRFSNGQRLMVRAIILLQFGASLAVIVMQVISGAIGLVATSRGEGASPGFGPIGLSALLVCLGGILDYLLASEARIVAGSAPQGAEPDHHEFWLLSEDRTWHTILEAARETHKLVIAAVVFFLFNVIAAGTGRVLLVAMVDTLALILVGAILWHTAIELAHLVRARPGQS